MRTFASRIAGMLCCCALLGPGQSRDDMPIVKVGRDIITVKEFLARYEMTPGINRRKHNAEANKAEFLLSMIAEKLLMQHGEREGWAEDTVVGRAMKEIEQLLVRDELYRVEISQRISISDSERSVALQRSLNDMKVYFLFARTKEGADFLSSQIKSGKALESFSFTGSDAEEFEGPDSAIARWGDVDERMEHVIYHLALNETSEPVKLDDGWYIVKLMGKTVSVLIGEKERKGQLEKVDAVLRKRKEQQRMSEFMSMKLRNTKTDVNARMLKSVVTHLWDVCRIKHAGRTDSTIFFVDRSMIAELRSRMNDTLRNSFVTFPHTQWSIETAMEKLTATNLAVVNPTLRRLRSDVEQRLREIIDQEYLVQIGYQQGLNQSAAVRKDVRMWKGAFVSQFVMNKIEDTVSVSQEEVEELKKVFQNDTAVVRNDSIAQMKMRQLKTADRIDRFIGGLAGKTEITFFEENFRDVSVTGTTSMVYRYLGFGGRMFAVPFVVPQTGWINYWKDSQLPLP